MQEYLKVTFKVDREVFEEARDFLFFLNCKGLEIVEENDLITFNAYFEKTNEVLKIFKNAEVIFQENWNENWKKYFTPQEIRKITVVPPWKRRHKELEICINPGLAFGTGTHPTTKMCLLLLQEIESKGKTLLDVGTGSGIIAIAGKKLGYEKVFACEIDKNSLREVLTNSKLNGVNILFFVGDVLCVNGNFDVVVANLDILAFEKVLEKVVSMVKDWAIFSGILTTQEEKFEKMLGNALRIIKKMREKEWTAYLCRR